MKNNYNKIFAERTKLLTVKVIKDFAVLPYSDAVSVIRKQLYRSVSSVAANYRAMCRARSVKEKYAKICIVVEEADETLFWLEIAEAIEMISQEKLEYLMIESEEILKVTAAYKKKLGEAL